MAKYVLTGTYCPDVLEKRAPYREAHLGRLAGLKAAGKVITIGPTRDLTRVFGVYETDSEAEARELIESDPYWQHQIWTSYELFEWIQAF
ncbi:YciI family protein [Gloeobacter kilaueensis]|uniref:YciI n=1 Tax=Gloeobacter kilaueensis (strain ATCC BAA-2537 / CCAP 1431/1 / ULC 316 / JS1) TaxID=1183438 RepID=U5QPK2_GLOK1|nr:YciI family protein [Gloeobacter kilaueensis]AGY59549.1 YciI [Gloeobacter kilaueensis JS1]